MRKQRMLPATVMALAATAAAFPATAHGQSLELKNEATQVHCPAVTLTGTDVDGGCMVHATGEGAGIFLRKHVFGIETTVGTCNMEFHGRANEDGSGYLFEQLMTPPMSGTCGRQPCKGGNGEAIPWPVTANEGAAVEGFEFVTINFCVEPPGGGTDEFCEIDFPFNEIGGSHTYEIGHNVELAAHGLSGFRCEAVAPHWSIEAGGMHDGQAEQDVEMIHLP